MSLQTTCKGVPVKTKALKQLFRDSVLPGELSKSLKGNPPN